MSDFERSERRVTWLLFTFISTFVSAVVSFVNGWDEYSQVFLFVSVFGFIVTFAYMWRVMDKYEKR